METAMKIHRSWIVLALALLLGGVGYVTAYAGYALLASPTAEAVVDIQRVVDNLHERTELEAQQRDRATKIQQAAEQKKKELDVLEEDLKLLTPGTPEYEETQRKWEQGSLELNVTLQYERQKLQREAQIQNERLFKKIIDAVGRVAQENGYDLVLSPESRFQLPTGNQQNPVRNVTLRHVLWHNGKNDITDQVVQLMNNEFANMVGGSP